MKKILISGILLSCLFANDLNYFDNLNHVQISNNNFVSQEIKEDYIIYFQDYRKIENNKDLLQFSIKTNKIVDSNTLNNISIEICKKTLNKIQTDVLAISFLRKQDSSWSEYAQYEFMPTVNNCKVINTTYNISNNK